VPSSESGSAVPVITFLQAGGFGRAATGTATAEKAATQSRTTAKRIVFTIEGTPVAGAG
jgi:hypothetical protein